MPAQYPTSVRTFTNKVDLVDTIFADHVNILQDEVRAIELTVGNTALTSAYTGTFVQTTTWTSVGARLANIETGLVNGVVGSPYFNKAGDVIAVVVITIACLALPLLLVAAWALQDVAQPAAQLFAQLCTCIAGLVKKRGKSRASSGSRDSTSRKTWVGEGRQ